MKPFTTGVINRRHRKNGEPNNIFLNNCIISVWLFQDPDNTPIKSVDDDEMYQLLELSHLEHDGGILDVDLHTILAWLVVAPYSKWYTI